MNNFFNSIIGLLNKVYRLDTYVKCLCFSISDYMKSLSEKIEILKNNFFFDSLNIDGITFFEKLLEITPLNYQTINDRRSNIQAKWLSKGHNSIALIQEICNCWKNGEAEADFINGKIYLKFVGEYGIPSDFDSLLKAIDEIKPAHLGIFALFKYLLIENIHLVKTIEEMQTLTINRFVFG